MDYTTNICHNDYLVHCLDSIDIIDNPYLIVRLFSGCDYISHYDTIKLFNKYCLTYDRFKKYCTDFGFNPKWYDIDLNLKEIYEVLTPLRKAIIRYRFFCFKYGLDISFEPLPERYD